MCTGTACNAAGENIASGYGPGWTSATEAAATAVDLWYAESALYNYKNAVYSDATGHFTALVWLASRSVGMGVAQLPDGQWFVVANFDPVGNVQGRFAQNVLQS